MASEPPTERPCEILTVSRDAAVPAPLRAADGSAPRGVARSADVVYASATYAAAALASVAVAAAARREARLRPRVRARAPLAALRRHARGVPGGGARRSVAALKRARTLALRRARRVIVPSHYLAELAIGWGLDPARVVVVHNPAPALAVEEVPEESRRGTASSSPAGSRAQKALHTALDAVARVPGADLLVLGDGPDRARLERHAAELGLNGRVRFAGSVPRAEVLRALAAAEAMVLSSDWENFPHAAVEALALGTPLIATAVGGVPEIVVDGVNGLLVPPGAPDGAGRGDRPLPRLRGPACAPLAARRAARSSTSRRRSSTAGSRRSWRRRRDERADRGGASAGADGRAHALHAAAPRVARAEVRRARAPARLPRPRLRRGGQPDRRTTASGSSRRAGRASSTACSSTCAFRSTSAARSASSGRRRSSPRAPTRPPPRRSPAASSAGERPRVVVEVHGDWRTATRLYGSSRRRSC